MELIFLTEKLLRQYYKLVIYPLLPLLCQSIWWHYRFEVLPGDGAEHLHDGGDQGLFFFVRGSVNTSPRYAMHTKNNQMD